MFMNQKLDTLDQTDPVEVEECRVHVILRCLPGTLHGRTFRVAVDRGHFIQLVASGFATLCVEESMMLVGYTDDQGVFRTFLHDSILLTTERHACHHNRSDIQRWVRQEADKYARWEKVPLLAKPVPPPPKPAWPEEPYEGRTLIQAVIKTPTRRELFAR